MYNFILGTQMKIGFSLGRCIRDIVMGKISEDEVAFVITSTCIREIDQLAPVIKDYMSRDDYLYGLDEAECQQVAQNLWDKSKLIQPRREGIHRHKQPANSIWVDIFPTEFSSNQATRKAWDHYRLMLQMTDNIDNEALETFK
jgi:hypothetical protein